MKHTESKSLFILDKYYPPQFTGEILQLLSSKILVDGGNEVNEENEVNTKYKLKIFEESDSLGIISFEDNNKSNIICQGVMTSNTYQLVALTDYILELMELDYLINNYNLPAIEQDWDFFQNLINKYSFDSINEGNLEFWLKDMFIKLNYDLDNNIISSLNLIPNNSIQPVLYTLNNPDEKPSKRLIDYLWGLRINIYGILKNIDLDNTFDYVISNLWEKHNRRIDHLTCSESTLLHMFDEAIDSKTRTELYFNIKQFQTKISGIKLILNHVNISEFQYDVALYSPYNYDASHDGIYELLFEVDNTIVTIITSNFNLNQG